MKRVLLLDTNVVLRFLCQDSPQESPSCTDFFLRAEQGEFTLNLDAVSFAEVVWVLSKFHKQPRERIHTLLSGLLQHPAVVVENQSHLLETLRIFAGTKIDFIDCYLVAQARETGHAVVTFDHDFKKFSDVKSLLPEKA